MKNFKLGSIRTELSRSEMKKITGGLVDEEGQCLGCNTDQECKDVGRGTCTKKCEPDNRCGCSGF